MKPGVARSARRRRTQSGNAIMEMGLCMILLFSIMFGIIEYSRLMYAYNFVSYAAQAAARYASLRGSTSTSPATSATVTAYVSSMAMALNSAQLSVATTWTPNNQPGSKVQVVVAYNESPLLTMVMPNAINVTNTAQMVILQ